MITLAMDTAATACAACLLDGLSGKVLAERSIELGRGHAEHLIDIIRACLVEAGEDFASIERIVATVGPGSFTGVRVGLATARGLGLGLGVPVTGVSSLEAAHACARELGASGPVAVVLDARRDEAYFQLFTDDEADEPRVLAYPQIAARLPVGPVTLCGSGAERLRSLVETGQPPVIHTLAAAPIATIARLGATRPAAGRPPEPIYLRPPDAKPAVSVIGLHRVGQRS